MFICMLFVIFPWIPTHSRHCVHHLYGIQTTVFIVSSITFPILVSPIPTYPIANALKSLLHFLSTFYLIKFLILKNLFHSYLNFGKEISKGFHNRDSGLSLVLIPY